MGRQCRFGISIDLATCGCCVLNGTLGDAKLVTRVVDQSIASSRAECAKVNCIVAHIYAGIASEATTKGVPVYQRARERQRWIAITVDLGLCNWRDIDGKRVYR